MSLEKVLDGKRNAVNRTAANVLKGGVSWVPDKIIVTGDSENPLPMKPFVKVSPNQDDLRGFRFGRFTVVGLSSHKSNKALWVVRCQCGIYSRRRSAAIKNPENYSDCCERCRQLLFIKRRDIQQRTGKDLDWRDIP
jgi:hypothetical protein